MRPWERWTTWLRMAEAEHNLAALVAAELALLAVHNVRACNVAELERAVCEDPRGPDELAAEYCKQVGLTV